MDPFAKLTSLFWWQTTPCITKKHHSQILETVRILPFTKHIKTFHTKALWCVLRMARCERFLKFVNGVFLNSHRVVSHQNIYIKNSVHRFWEPSATHVNKAKYFLFYTNPSGPWWHSNRRKIFQKKHSWISHTISQFYSIFDECSAQGGHTSWPTRSWKHPVRPGEAAQ